MPPGRVISAVRPAPMRWWMTYPMTIVDTIFKALAPAIPGRVIAGHHADLLASSFHGINTRTSEFFIGSFGPLGGGWGAKLTEDGVSGTVCINDGDTHNSPNEQAEFKFPIVVERYALVPDSGGAGRRRGGLGVERVVRARGHIMVNNQSDRAHCRPWGLDGGLEGTGNAVEIRVGGQWKTDFPNAKVLVAQLKPGDAFKIRSGGGGGYGDPLARPIEQVREDVRQGYVSVAAAAEHYGVVLDPQTFAVDMAATEKLRAARRSSDRRGSSEVCIARNARPPRFACDGPRTHFGGTNPTGISPMNPKGRRLQFIFTCQTANASPPGDLDFRAPGVALSLFPSPLHAREMERREAPGACERTPGEPCEGPPRAVAIRRAHPNDVGVRRLPALHLRHVGRGHVLPAPAAPLRTCFRRSQQRLRRGESYVHDMFFLGMLSRATAHRLSFAVYDIPPAPQHGQLMATRMFCFCSSSRSVRSSICLACCSNRSCSGTEL